jgi:hypothetical protein
MCRSSSNLVMVHWFWHSYPSWNYKKIWNFQFPFSNFYSVEIAGLVIFDSYPSWNWKRLNMTLKLWLSVGAFVVLMTHLVMVEVLNPWLHKLVCGVYANNIFKWHFIWCYNNDDTDCIYIALYPCRIAAQSTLQWIITPADLLTFHYILTFLGSIQCKQPLCRC